MRAATSGAIRGLYVLTPDEHDASRLVDRVAAAIAGGARLVQYRSKGAPDAIRREQARALQALCAARSVPLIVNDDPALAAEIGAAGVHVGADDVPAAAARAIVGPDAIVGVSCYADLERARRAIGDGADYVAFGSFFSSPTKPHAVRADTRLVREAKAIAAVPVVAIGGITAADVDALRAAGVDAVAVISAVFDAPDIEAAARRIARRFETTGDRR
jgi:thiamine-phosphate pyrophosphorylase